MTDPSGDPTLHSRTIARARIAKARAATIAIDQDLWPPIERLQRAGESANGAGIYADVTRFRSALYDAAAAIARAQKIVRETSWPTDQDYDIA